MSANTLAIIASDSGKEFPLRGDMAVTLNFVPDANFEIEFRTFDAGSYTLTSTGGTFRQIDGSLASSLVISGKASLWTVLRFNVIDAVWELHKHNLVSGGTTTVSGGGGGTGSGKGNLPLVVLTPDSSGNVAVDGSVSNNFQINLAGNVKLLNPVNFVAGDAFTIVYKQDLTGSRALTHDTLYALPNAQPVTLSTTPLTFDIITYNAFQDGSILGYITRPTIAAFSKVTPIAMIGSTLYYMIGGAGGTGVFNKIVNGDTAYILRNGTGAEVTGTIVTAANEVYRVTGQATGVGTDQRPFLKLLPTNRPAYGKALLNFEGFGSVYLSNVRLNGARNDDMDARGTTNNSDGVTLYLNNVEISNCCNGVLNGNASMTGNTYLADVLIDRCGVGGISTTGVNTVGFTHSVYFGHNNTEIHMDRVTLSNAISGDNLKSRSWKLFANQVLCIGAAQGRELELPNGSWAELTNCKFWKQNQEGTGNMVLVGGNGQPDNTNEGLDTSRTRKYKFTNCHFRSDYVLEGRDSTLACNLDGVVPMEFIDCLFEGPSTNGNYSDPNNAALYTGTTTVKGIRYKPSAPPIYTLTGGPLGPVLPVGYFPIGMANVS